MFPHARWGKRKEKKRKTSAGKMKPLARPLVKERKRKNASSFPDQRKGLIERTHEGRGENNTRKRGKI